MTIEKTFKKALKVVLPKQILIIPFTGNLTNSKKEELALTVQKYFQDKNKVDVPLADILKSIFYKMYGSIEKELIFKKYKERVAISGKGWSCNNLPESDVTILSLGE